MKIDCIIGQKVSTPVVSCRVNCGENLSSNSKLQVDTFEKQSQKNKRQISFGNRPWELKPQNFGVSRTGNITGSEAIRLYTQLKSGNYLDIGDDSFDFYNCNRIREENLSFLDRLNYSSDKREFVRFYEDFTGFPNLKVVSRNIRNTFLGAVEQAQRDLYFDRYNVVLAGYDGLCSVGRGKAFPGSDLDKAYVILQGTGYPQGDIEAVDKFKGKLWEYTDQRLLSYNHDEAAFPQVYTKEQIEDLKKIELTNLKSEDMWILSKYNKVLKSIENHMEKYEFNLVGSEIYDFTWNYFCDYYIEMAKYSIESNTTKSVLYTVLTGILKILHPFMPFVTEEIYKMLPIKDSESIMISEYPKYDKNYLFEVEENIIDDAVEFIKNFRNVKAKNNITKDFKVMFDTNSDNELIIKMLKLKDENIITKPLEINVYNAFNVGYTALIKYNGDVLVSIK